MSLSFSANFGSFDSLKVRTRCGASWWASRMRCTDRKLTPAAFARIRPVQWVASPGGGPSAKSITRCTVAAGSGGLPGLRVLSRVSPSTPSAMNRSCQRQTTGLALPDRRMISVVPQPSAVARMILARQTCFCRSVQRILEAHQLAPHRVHTFKLSNDANFPEKLKDIVGLYVDPPAHAVVLSVDEKSQIQALDRTQPGLPMKSGRAGTMTHDYKRHGTTTLFAALNVLDGTIIGRNMKRHR